MMTSLIEEPAAMKNNFLNVEDEMAGREMMTFSLSKEGFNTFNAASGHEVLAQLIYVHPDLIAIDQGFLKLNLTRLT